MDKKKKQLNPDLGVYEKEEKTPFLLRWWVIAIAVLFAWPIAVVLIITKIIGAVRKTRKDKPHMSEERRQQIRKTITYFLLTFIFLVLGCVGLTRDYLELFFGNGFSGSLLTQIVPHVILALLGIFIASQGYNILFAGKEGETDPSHN